MTMASESMTLVFKPDRRAPMPTLDETRAWVRELFDGVTDKGGKPYAEHCFRVEAGLPASADEDTRHAALLHDVLEDTFTGMTDLQARGYSRRAAGLVLASRRARRDLRGIHREDHQLARSDLIQIKLSDNRDNSDPARIECLPPSSAAS
jgi:(p)ppGpp synthase/HD superfamily hydrolase